MQKTCNKLMENTLIQVHRCGPGGSMRVSRSGPGFDPGRDKFPGGGFSGFFLTCKTNVGKLQAPKVPDYHLAIVSSLIIIHYGGQWPEMLTLPKKTSNKQIGLIKTCPPLWARRQHACLSRSGPRFDPWSGQVSWVRFFLGFSSPVRQMSGSFKPPRSPNIIWPSLSSSLIIHYGRQ